MAISAIIAAATVSGFWDQTNGDLEIADLQQLYEATGSTETVAELLARACENGFYCADKGDSEIAEAQMWNEALEELNVGPI